MKSVENPLEEPWKIPGAFNEVNFYFQGANAMRAAEEKLKLLQQKEEMIAVGKLL